MSLQTSGQFLKRGLQAVEEGGAAKGLQGAFRDEKGERVADQLPTNFTPLFAALLALPIAALAIVSDLVESIIKRYANAKDAGATIPGIGGVFDLSDSLILTAPVGYVVFSLL
jgi:CDP-diglyceride synthetase